MPITALGFLAVFSIGSLVALKRPFVGLLLYFFVFYMHPPGKYWGVYIPEMRWTLIVALITLISTFIHEKNKGEWFKHTESKLIFAFFIYLLIQYPFVLSKGWHAEYIVLFFKMLLLYFLMITIINTQRRLEIVIVANVLGAAYIGFNALQVHSSGRFEAAGLPSINDSNLLGIHILPVLLMAAFLFLSKNNRNRYWLLLPLAIVANLVIMTGSRGAIVSLVIAGILTLFLAPKIMKKTLWRWGVLAMIGLTFVSVDLVVNRLESMMANDNNKVEERSAESRIVIIEAQIGMVKERPILGGGHRTTLLLSPYYISEEYMTSTSQGKLRGSHNITFSILADHGIIGFSIMALLLWSALKSLNRIKNSSEFSPGQRYLAMGILASFLAYILASQFSNSKVLEMFIWLVALSSCLKSITNSQLQRDKNDNDL